jgi:hypothetical protein
VIECEATDSEEVANVAFPLEIVPVPSVVVPSLNVTVPVAADGVTVAVNVTAAPKVVGLLEEDSATEVLVLAWAVAATAIQAKHTSAT